MEWVAVLTQPGSSLKGSQNEFASEALSIGHDTLWQTRQVMDIKSLATTDLHAFVLWAGPKGEHTGFLLPVFLIQSVAPWATPTF